MLGFIQKLGGEGTTRKHVKTFSKIDSDTILDRNCHGSELTTRLSTTTIEATLVYTVEPPNKGHFGNGSFVGGCPYLGGS